MQSQQFNMNSLNNVKIQNSYVLGKSVINGCTYYLIKDKYQFVFNSEWMNDTNLNAYMRTSASIFSKVHNLHNLKQAAKKQMIFIDKKTIYQLFLKEQKLKTLIQELIHGVKEQAEKQTLLFIETMVKNFQLKSSSQILDIGALNQLKLSKQTNSQNQNQILIKQISSHRQIGRINKIVGKAKYLNINSYLYLYQWKDQKNSQCLFWGYASLFNNEKKRKYLLKQFNQRYKEQVLPFVLPEYEKIQRQLMQNLKIKKRNYIQRIIGRIRQTHINYYLIKYNNRSIFSSQWQTCIFLIGKNQKRSNFNNKVQSCNSLKVFDKQAISNQFSKQILCAKSYLPIKQNKLLQKYNHLIKIKSNQHKIKHQLTLSKNNINSLNIKIYNKSESRIQILQNQTNIQELIQKNIKYLSSFLKYFTTFYRLFYKQQQTLQVLGKAIINGQICYLIQCHTTSKFATSWIPFNIIGNIKAFSILKYYVHKFNKKIKGKIDRGKILYLNQNYIQELKITSKMNKKQIINRKKIMKCQINKFNNLFKQKNQALNQDLYESLQQQMKKQQKNNTYQKNKIRQKQFNQNNFWKMTQSIYPPKKIFNKILGKAKSYKTANLYLIQWKIQNNKCLYLWQYMQCQLRNNKWLQKYIDQFNIKYQEKQLPFIVEQYQQSHQQFMNLLKDQIKFRVDKIIAKAIIHQKKHFLVKWRHLQEYKIQWIKSISFRSRLKSQHQKQQQKIICRNSYLIYLDKERIKYLFKKQKQLNSQKTKQQIEIKQEYKLNKQEQVQSVIRKMQQNLQIDYEYINKIINKKSQIKSVNIINTQKQSEEQEQELGDMKLYQKQNKRDQQNVKSQFDQDQQNNKYKYNNNESVEQQQFVLKDQQSQQENDNKKQINSTKYKYQQNELESTKQQDFYLNQNNDYYQKQKQQNQQKQQSQSTNFNENNQNEISCNLNKFQQNEIKMQQNKYKISQSEMKMLILDIKTYIKMIKRNKKKQINYQNTKQQQYQQQQHQQQESQQQSQQSQQQSQQQQFYKRESKYKQQSQLQQQQQSQSQQFYKRQSQNKRQSQYKQQY